MIRQSESQTNRPESRSDETQTFPHKDSALWAPTAWVHVEKDIDFSDPKVLILISIASVLLHSYIT